MTASPTATSPASPSPTPAPQPSPTPTPRSPATVQVAIYDFGFNPATITVAPGTTVVWVNTGAVQHTVADKQLTWSSSILDPGARFEHTFTQPGEYAYWCTLHPNMLGTVIVRQP
jgi:plastocyanin